MKKYTVQLVLSSLVLFSVTLSGAPGNPLKEVRSPNGSLVVNITLGDEIVLMASLKDRKALTVKNPGMVINGTKTATGNFTIKTRTVNREQHPVIREKRAVVYDNFNEIIIAFRDKSGFIVRVYNDGFAYRFFTRFQDDTVEVNNETALICLARGDSLYLPVIRCREEKDVDCFHTSFEEEFVHAAIGEVSTANLAYLPVYARTTNGISMAISESDLRDYPGMFVSGSHDNNNSLAVRFPAYPVETSIRGNEFRQELVTKRADYIARTSGNREYPWRVFIMGENDGDLVNSDMVYRLAPECKLTETDWIKPGQITDEWIINSILYGIDFKSGINTMTYKYYIDFANRFGLDYVFLDAGWCEVEDFRKINPEVDIAELVRYGREKNVGIWLWTSALTLKNNMSYLQEFNRWGIRGIMVDFMDREDQLMVRFQEMVARETSNNKLMLLFHGASKPIGLRKAYPNVITREGVAGHEFDKWTEQITPEHNLIIPFTRMIAGPLDYEGGGMINAQKNAFRIVDPVPMTQGTRIHQLAMYIVYENPLQYLAGSISDYIREPAYASFFGSMPTVWDETVVLAGKISDYILVARRSGNDWWVAAMTDWTPRSLELDLSFFGTGNYQAEIYSDGINANNYAADYKIENRYVSSSDSMTIHLAPGGGWVSHFTPR